VGREKETEVENEIEIEHKTEVEEKGMCLWPNRIDAVEESDPDFASLIGTGNRSRAKYQCR
jgi:hypothetical protein